MALTLSPPGIIIYVYNPLPDFSIIRLIDNVIEKDLTAGSLHFPLSQLAAI